MSKKLGHFKDTNLFYNFEKWSVFLELWAEVGFYVAFARDAEMFYFLAKF